MQFLSAVDTTTGRTLIIVEAIEQKENGTLIIEDSLFIQEVSPTKARKILKSWMTSVKRDNP